ncbi:MAG: hypothetical protein JNM66_09015 [Bryobacterales bacterium]|nr:hypothetical protein [Bryobacterales bacterium]
MHCKQFTHTPRRIALLLRALVLVSGLSSALTLAAESPAVRFSSPSMGWILAADGSQAIEITGVADSPRAGRAVALPSAARRSWVAPDATAAVLRLDSGLFLLRSSDVLELLAPLDPGIAVSVAWDRASAGFALCWAESCESRAADGAIRAQWDVPSASRALAFSVADGLVVATADTAFWYSTNETVALQTLPVAAAFRSGPRELWSVDAAGNLLGQDMQGRRTGEAELVANPLGLVGSLDGGTFFAANAEGEAAIFTFDAARTEKWNVEDTVEGAWAAPGVLAVRLHESAKRPVAIWNSETRTTGWMPAETPSATGTEVRQ